jgi:hypothetical protein
LEKALIANPALEKQPSPAVFQYRAQYFADSARMKSCLRLLPEMWRKLFRLNLIKKAMLSNNVFA